MTRREEAILPSRYWVTVYYATNRAQTGSQLAEKFFGKEDAGHLNLGIVRVTVPPIHAPGDIEAPSLTRLEFKRDPQKHMVLHEVRPLTGKVYFDSIRTVVSRSEQKELFVYVHGFDNTFEYAVLRAAQLAYDINFQGAPIVYSWPSAGGGPLTYARDRRYAEAGAKHLRHFLDLLAERSGAETIHVIAHSMGNFVLQNALAAGEHPRAIPWKGKLHQVVLAAADLDATGMRKLASVLRRDPGHDTPQVTAYASNGDIALQASLRVHHVAPFGLIAGAVQTLPEIDVVDASDLESSFIGHAYFAANRLSLQELKFLLLEGWKPEKRKWLKRSADGKYWVYCGLVCN